MKKMNNLEKTRFVMANVMAALRAFGVEYATNVYGFSVEKKLCELMNDVKTVEYCNDNNGKTFKSKLEKFLSIPHYCSVRGAYWADDGDYVVIQLSRLYEMDEKDWQDFADFWGCDDSMEASMNYGDPTPSYIRMNVRVKKDEIEDVVKIVAPHCW